MCSKTSIIRCYLFHNVILQSVNQSLTDSQGNAGMFKVNCVIPHNEAVIRKPGPEHCIHIFAMLSISNAFSVGNIKFQIILYITYLVKELDTTTQFLIAGSISKLFSLPLLECIIHHQCVCQGWTNKYFSH